MSGESAAVARPTPIPALRGIPILGALQNLLVDRLALLERLGATGKEVIRTQVGGLPAALVTSPELIHAVLVERAEDFHKAPSLRRYGQPILGDGLLSSEADFHRQQRKLVAPAFHHRRIATYAEVMAAYGEEAQAAWPDGAVLNVAREMTRLTLRIVGKTLFDADVLQEADELGAALTTVQEYVTGEIRSPLHVPLSWPTPYNRRVRHAIGRLDATVYRLINERRASGEDKGDLLSMLLLAQDADDGGRMSDRQVRDEAMTLFLAGHETTANALAWTWYLLARHPEAYARVREEADTTLGGRTPGFEDMPNLSYAIRVLKEAMRLYPPAYYIARQALRDITLGDYHIPRGMVLMISPYVMHHSARYFAEPQRFDPDRFTPQAETALPRYAYMPFGGGTRMCIGSQFAMQEGPLLLATLAQRVTFALVPGQRIVPQPLITLRPRGGIRMVVKRR